MKGKVLVCMVVYVYVCTLLLYMSLILLVLLVLVIALSYYWLVGTSEFTGSGLYVLLVWFVLWMFVLQQTVK